MFTKTINGRTIPDTNIGGVASIYWVPMDYLESLPLFGRVNISDILLSTEDMDSFRTVIATRETASFVEEPAQGPNGPYTKIKIPFKISKHYSDRIAQFLDMREREYFVAAFDENGLGKCVGEINLRGERKGMTFHEGSTTGERNNELNSYDAYFYCEIAGKAREAYYTTPPPLDIESGGPID